MNQHNPNIKPTDMQPIVCKECECIYFRQVMAINKVAFLSFKIFSAIYKLFRCDDCGAIPEEFQPVKIKKNDK